MQNTVNVLYYSNYSPSSTALFNMIKENNVNIADLFYIKLINVDCSTIRLKLLKTKKIKMDKVPCLLCVDNMGNIKQYHDKELFDLFRTIIKEEQDKIQEKELCSALDAEVKSITDDFQKCAQQSSSLINTISEYESYITDMNSKYQLLEEELNNTKLEMDALKEENIERAANFKKKVQFTNQDDALAENESKINTDELSELNPMGGSIRTDSLNYDNKVDFGEVQEVNRDVSHKLEPNNIMQQAEQMQKDRDE